MDGLEYIGTGLYRFAVRSSAHTQMIDITETVGAIVDESGIDDGMCFVYVPHTTAGVSINENADPDVRTDLMDALDKAVPWEGGYRHAEGNSAAHVKASLIGTSEMIPVNNGRLVLGTWQGIYFMEFDGSRDRLVYVKVVKE